MKFTINNTPYEIRKFPHGYAWIKDGHVTVIAHPTAYEAQQEAMDMATTEGN